MTVFYCMKCGAALTPELTALSVLPDVVGWDDVAADERARIGRSTIPQGFYAIDPEPWGAPFVPLGEGQRSRTTPRTPLRPNLDTMTADGPRNSVVLHPSDALDLQPFIDGRNNQGCCGPTGAFGPNLACRCGSRLATLAADCMGPCELHLDPVRTTCRSSAALP